MGKKRIIIFDLDDTLIESDAKIRIHDSKTNKEVGSLTPSQFNYHVKNQNQYLSYHDFGCEKILGRSRIISKTFRSFRRYYNLDITLSIITARESKKLVLDFFKSKEIYLKPSNVYAVHDPKANFTGNIAERKKQAIKDLIRKGYNDIVYYDDNLDNLNTSLELVSDDVQIKIIQVLNEQKKNKTR